MSRLQYGCADTLDVEALERIHAHYTDPEGYHLQEDSGNGCFLDPPGYPSYFTRNVYTRSGNTPGRDSAVHMVLSVPGGHTYALWTGEVDYETHAVILRAIWRPLPLDHARTRAWINCVFSHQSHCYRVPKDALPPDVKDDMLIWPGGCCGGTPFGELRDVLSQTDYARRHKCYDKWEAAHQKAFCDEIAYDNARISAECEKHATPDRHLGTLTVREFYPEFVPTAELIKGGYAREGYWWETMAEKPAPERCPGQYGHKHPVNTDWCQFCGWSGDK